MSPVRPPLPRDLAPIADLTNHFIRNTTIHFGFDPVTPADVQAQIDHAAAGNFPFLVAELEDDGAFAGFAKAGVWRERAAYHRTAEVAAYVAEHARRRGIATALYTALLDDLRRKGFHLAVAGITLPNDASVRFHESLGFTHVGTFTQCGRKFDQWHDVGFWQLLLD